MQTHQCTQFPNPHQVQRKECKNHLRRQDSSGGKKPRHRKGQTLLLNVRDMPLYKYKYRNNTVKSFKYNPSEKPTLNLWLHNHVHDNN